MPPLVFVSHKHSDRTVAEVIARFVQDQSNGEVRAFLSSNPEFVGPRFGKQLNAQLRQALWETDVLILVYTSEDENWAYCMWECGVATRPDSPDTEVIVFQCGTDVPGPFQDALRVNVRSLDDLRRFTADLFRAPRFFPSLGVPLAPRVSDQVVHEAALDLKDRLAAVLPREHSARVEGWPVLPFLQIEVPSDEADRLVSAPEPGRTELARAILLDHGVILDHDSRLPQLFGRASLPVRMEVRSLVNAWQDGNPEVSPEWFDSCAEQMEAGTRREFPVIRWTPVREAHGAEHIPVLSRVRRIPFARVVHYDFYFYNLSDPRAVPVTELMIPAGEFFAYTLAGGESALLRLSELLGMLEARGLNRVPVLDAQGCVLYILHRSMIDRFIVERITARLGPEVEEVTLSDLLSNEKMRTIFQSTFAVIGREASLAEAKSLMVKKPDCRDVFVTASGSPTEPVIGWLTNVDMEKGA